MRLTAWPPLRSRTVPTKATTAPTPASPARSAATSADRSKSALRTDTRSAMLSRRSPAGRRPPRRRRPARVPRRTSAGPARSALPGRAPALRHGAGCARPRLTQAPTVLPAGMSSHLLRAERLAQRREVAHLDLHRQISSDRGGSDRIPAPQRLARRVVHQAVGPHGGGEHARALVGEQVESAVAVEPHAQELAALVGPGPVEIGAHRQPAGRAGSAPCSARSTGATHIRNVTKLDTGLPGSPMNSASRRRRAARTEGQRLARLDGDLPQLEPAFGHDGRLEVVFFAHRHAAGAEDQVVARRRLRSASAWPRSRSGTMPKSVHSQPAAAAGRAA